MVRNLVTTDRVAATLRGFAALLLCDEVLGRVARPSLRFVFGPVSPAIRHQYLVDHLMQPRILVPYDVQGIVDALIAASLLLLTERGGWSARRLIERSNLPRSRAGIGQVIAGSVVGVVAMGLIMGALAALGFADVEYSGFAIGAMLHSLAVWFGTYALLALSEELLYRGYPLRAMTDGIGFPAAAVVTSLWFGWLHWHEGDPLPGALSVVLFALFAALTWRATGSLAFAIGFHASWDFTESTIFGVPDSGTMAAGAVFLTHVRGPAMLTGGGAGPEGSAFAILLNVALIVVAFLAIRKADPWNDRSSLDGGTAPDGLQDAPTAP